MNESLAVSVMAGHKTHATNQQAEAVWDTMTTTTDLEQ